MAPLRAVTYSRFSSDMQKDSSITDQQSLCAGYCERQGWTIVQEYHDRALSGTTMLGRAGLIALLEAAERREFDLVVTEGIDRISRDKADLAYINKRLEFVDIRIATPHHGVIDDIGMSVHGIVSSMFVRNLREKVKRSHSGLLRQGRLPGPPIYGYERGDNPGEWRINEQQAAVVRNVYERFAQGESAQRIADHLNSQGIPSPKGNIWNRSTLTDRVKARPGMLGNPTYLGRPRWNVTKKVRAPDGRRMNRQADPGECVELHLPHLQIIDQALWDAVAKVREQRRALWMPNGRTRRQPVPRTFDSPLAGLLRCSHCGSHLIVGASEGGHKRVVCSNARRSTLVCQQLTYFRADKVEQAVFDVLFACFEDAEFLQAYIDTYREKRKALAAEAKRDEAKTRKRLTDVKASIARFVGALERGSMPEETIYGRLQQLEAERVDLERRLDDAELTLSEQPARSYSFEAWSRAGETLTNLQVALADPVRSAKARADLRAMIESVKVFPSPARQPYRVQINTRVGVLLGLEPLPEVRTPFEIAAAAGVNSFAYVHAASAAR
jgi:site-specific DNA recombinase